MYNNDSIGERVYQPLWGVDSMYDVVARRLGAEAVADYSQMDIILTFFMAQDEALRNPTLERRAIIKPPEQVNFVPSAYVLHSPLEEDSWITGKFKKSAVAAAVNAALNETALGGVLQLEEEVFIPEGVTTINTSDIDPRGPRAARVFTAIKRMVENVPHAREHYNYLFAVDAEDLHATGDDTGALTG